MSFVLTSAPDCSSFSVMKESSARAKIYSTTVVQYRATRFFRITGRPTTGTHHQRGCAGNLDLYRTVRKPKKARRIFDRYMEKF